MNDIFSRILRRLQTMQRDVIASSQRMNMDVAASSTGGTPYIYCTIFMEDKHIITECFGSFMTSAQIENTLNIIKSIVYGNKRQSDSSLASGAGNERNQWQAVG